ncbi:YkyA family protein [Neobacillus sp. Marseille-QA0830]
MSGCKQQFLIYLLMILFMLTGCVQKQTPAEEMHDVLEQVVSKEKTFEDQQRPLINLENKEKSYYDEIISLGMKEYDRIAKLSDQAIDSADERKEYFEKETKSLKQSQQTFEKVKSIKGRIDESSLRKSADQLYQTMLERYQAHDTLYKEYMTSVKNDIQLYKMFKNKNIPMTELEDQVNKVNESYNKVYAAKERFNNLTEDFNKKKLAFYKQAGL